MNSYYTETELFDFGLRSCGNNVLISRKSSLYNSKNISIGSNVRIDDFCILSGGSGITLGSYIHVGSYSAIYGGSGVFLEDYSGLSPRCTIFSESDDFSGNSLISPFFPAKLKPHYISKSVVLGKFSQVGTNSTLLPGATLGEGSVVGAHSLVLKSCKPWSIYAGIPAKLLKERSRKILELEKDFHAQMSDRHNSHGKCT